MTLPTFLMETHLSPCKQQPQLLPNHWPTLGLCQTKNKDRHNSQWDVHVQKKDRFTHHAMHVSRSTSTLAEMSCIFNRRENRECVFVVGEMSKQNGQLELLV